MANQSSDRLTGRQWAAAIIGQPTLAMATVTVVAGIALSASDVAPVGEQPRAGTKATPAPKVVDPLPAGAIGRLGSRAIHFNGPTSEIAFAPDGKSLFCSESLSNGGVCQIDLATGRVLRRFANIGDGAGIDYRVSSAVAVTRDGKLLAAHSRSAIIIWDVETGNMLRRMEVRAPSRNTLGFSPDGRILAVWGMAGISLWDIALGQRHTSLSTEPVAVAAFTPDGKTLITGSPTGNNVLQLWEVANGKLAGTLGASLAPVFALAVSPDGKTLASVGQGMPIHLWDLGSRRIVRQFDSEGLSPGSLLAFSSAGELLSGDRQLTVWNTTTGQKDRAFPTGSVPGQLWLLPDGLTLVAKGETSLGVFDVATGRERFPNKAPHFQPFHLAFAPDNRTLAMVYESELPGKRVLHFWDLRTGQRIERFPKPVPCNGPFARSSDGRYLVTTFYSSVRVHDAATGEERYRWDGTQAVPRLAVLGGGLRVAIGCPEQGDGVVRIWNPAANKIEHELGGHGYFLRALAASPDGKQIVTVRSPDRPALRLWDSNTGRLVRESGPDNACNVAFSPDGKLLAVSLLGSPQIRLLDVTDGHEVRTLENGSDFALVAFSPDGKTVAATSREGPWYVLPNGRMDSPAGDAEDAYVRVWDVATGQEIRRFHDPDSFLYCLAFSPDGKTLATGGSGTPIVLWDLTTPTPLAALPPRIPMPKFVGLVPETPPPVPLPAADVARHWTELATHNVRANLRAMAALAAAGNQPVQYLAQRLRPVAPPDAQRLNRLFVDLDSNQFAVRQRASSELEKLGELAAPALRKLLEGQPSAEVRSRVEDLLGRQTVSLPTGDRLQELLAVQVLKQIGTPEARQVLTTLANGADGARLTREAKDALDRLAKRPP